MSLCSWAESLSASPGLDIILKCTHFPLVAHYIVCYINARVTSGGKYYQGAAVHTIVLLT
jgi:glutamate racemase